MIALPRHVIPKRLASGAVGYYYNVPTKYRKLKCSIANEPLGTDYAKMEARARTLNGLFDEWDQARKGTPVTGTRAPMRGSIDWLFEQYRTDPAYKEKVAPRSRSDYEWAMRQVCDTIADSGERIGGRHIKAVTTRAADKLYTKFIIPTGKKKMQPGALRLRTGEKFIAVCERAWDVVQRHYPDLFDSKVPNPWSGVTTKVRAKVKKSAVTREEVFAFAEGAMEAGYPEAAATAVICFEWLQRPENVVKGFLTWNDYRSPSMPSIIRIEHHKTGTTALHPLEEITVEGKVLFYAEAEEVLDRLPRLGVPMILRDIGDGKAKLWRYSSLNHVVARLRKKIDGVPAHFTLDACRHGGMTELEEAELTDGQGRALSTHKTQQSYEGYAKRSTKRMLSATRKRYAHRLANETVTSVQNGAPDGVQNENQGIEKSA